MVIQGRIHSLTNFELERFLWRHQQGWYDGGRIMDELSRQVDKLAAHSFKLNDEKERLRRFRQEELIHMDNLRGEIVLHIGRAEFDTAIEKIKQSFEILRELEDTNTAAEHYDSVREAIDKLFALTGENLFADTPTIKIITQLQKKTREYLESKETRKASLNLLVCRSEMAHLSDIQEDIIRSKRLRSKVEDLDTALERFGEVKSPGENDEIYFSKTNRIKELINAGYLALAERLLEEFEIKIGDKLLFLSEYRKASGRLKKSILKKRKNVSQWDDAAGHLLEKRLGTTISYLGRVNREVDKFLGIKEEEK